MKHLPDGKGVEIRKRSYRLRFLDSMPTVMMSDGQPLRPSAANTKRVFALAAEIRDKIALGVFSLHDYPELSPIATKAGITLGEWLESWIATQRVAHSTLHGYRTAVNFWTNVQPRDSKGNPRPALGTMVLRAIKHSDILSAIAARSDFSGKTIRNYVNVLQQAFALALRDKQVSEDVTVGIPRAKWQRKPVDPFSLDEAERIIEAFYEHAPEPVAASVEFWFFSGLRTSEWAGLKWPQVNLSGSEPYVRISEALVAGKVEAETKTSVVRDVLLNSRSLPALKRMRKYTQVANGNVFLDPLTDHAWVHESIFRRRYWEPILKRLGIRYRRPYQMRHSFATMMLMAKRTPGWCAQQMGHSVEIFHSTYAKWIKGAQDKRELAGFDEWLRQSKPRLRLVDREDT